MIGKRKEECSNNLEFKNIHIENDYELNLRKEIQHFIIYYTKIDSTCIDKVSDILENSYDRITMNFNQ